MVTFFIRQKGSATSTQTICVCVSAWYCQIYTQPGREKRTLLLFRDFFGRRNVYRLLLVRKGKSNLNLSLHTPYSNNKQQRQQPSICRRPIHTTTNGKPFLRVNSSPKYRLVFNRLMHTHTHTIFVCCKKMWIYCCVYRPKDFPNMA